MNPRVKFIRYIIGVGLFFALCSGALLTLAKPIKEGEEQKAIASTIEITADSLEYDIKRHRALLVGKVHVVDGSVNLKADQMEVVFSEQNDIIQLEGRGHVIITRGKQRAEAGRMSYQVKEDIAILFDQPILFGDNLKTINAEKIIYSMKEGIFKTKGGRPKTFFYRLKKKKLPE